MQACPIISKSRACHKQIKFTCAFFFGGRACHKVIATRWDYRHCQLLRYVGPKHFYAVGGVLRRLFKYAAGKQ